MFNPGYAPVWIHLVTDYLSIFLGFLYYKYLSKKTTEGIIKEGDNSSLILFIGIVVGALFGSRLIAGLERPDLFFNPPSILFYYSVKTIAGGLVGGILGAEIFKKILGIKKSTGDIMVGPLALGIIVGRVGCFLIGVRDATAGNVSNLPWAIDQGDGLLRHPTSLYEIFFVLLLWAFIEFLRNSKDKARLIKWFGKYYAKVSLNGEGLYFRLFCLGYFLFRLFVEFIKPVQPIFGGLTAIQWTSIFVCIVYAQSIGILINKGSLYNE